MKLKKLKINWQQRFLLNGPDRKRNFLMKEENGFSLIEVLIAITIFAVFISVYVTSQGYNVSDSYQMKEEMKLKELCEQAINKIILDPPDFRLSLTLQPTVKTFEDDPNYSYKVTWKEFKIPDLSRLQGEKEDDNTGGGSKQQRASKMIYKKFQENMKKMLWQVEVTVTNKETNFFYTLSTWLVDQKVKLKLGL